MSRGSDESNVGTGEWVTARGPRSEAQGSSARQRPADDASAEPVPGGRWAFAPQLPSHGGYTSWLCQLVVQPAPWGLEEPRAEERCRLPKWEAASGLEVAPAAFRTTRGRGTKSICSQPPRACQEATRL